MIIKKNIISKKGGMSYLQILILMTSIFAFSFLLSAEEVSAQTADYCCEKTNYGAWCQNTKQENCKEGLRKAPTSCDATSYCKEGCCYDSQEGLCMENTPQKVCNDKNGTWADSAECNIPQCNLGCCVLDNQAAFVTLTRCKRLSGFYGLETDFRTGIGNELECIAVTQTKERGACIYEEEFTKTCKFTTREDCEKISSTGNLTEPEFYPDYLCSAEELATGCGPSSETMCVGGKDEVYFKDTCGNPANVYDASKINDKLYWKKIIDKAESCEPGKNNAESKSCGNCDYYLGSICREAERTKRATYGDYICKDLNCYKASDGKDHEHGESWCSYDGATGKGVDAVGSRQVRHICVNSEEITEPCQDLRQEVCIEGKTETTSGVFQEAACRVNRWQDCAQQDEQEDCENTDKRDCFWLKGVKFPKSEEEITAAGTTTTGKTITGYGLFGSSEEEKEEPAESGVQLGGGACVPNVPPGLKFWTEGEAEGICKIASSQCIVTYEKGLLGGEKCVENCECLEETWAKKMNQVCSALGDCGAYVNYVGKFTDEGVEWKIGKEKQKLSQAFASPIRSAAGIKTTGKTIDTGNAGVNAFVVAVAKSVSWVIGGSVVSGQGEWTPTIEQQYKLAQYRAGQLPNPNGAGSGVAAASTTALTATDTATIKNLVAAKDYKGAQDLIATLKAKGVTSTGMEKLDAALAEGNLAEVEAEVNSLAAAQPKPHSWLSGIVGATASGFLDAALTGVQYAAIGYGIGQLAGSLLGIEKKQTSALSTALAAGSFTWQFLGTYTQGELGQKIAASWFGKHPFLAGLGVAAVVFLLLYKKESQVIVTFNCMPWQAPVGKVAGNDCEKCNEKEGCSEYRCKSLGQACQLLNAGSKEERCAWVNPKDAKSPGISPWEEVLTPGYKYTDVIIRPPGDGVEPGRMRIVKEGSKDGCVEAFTPLEFGIVTIGPDNVAEPAQCKIDYNHTQKFDDMAFYFGESNLFDYNHSQKMSLPGPSAVNAAAPEIQDDGTYTLYARCRDANGNENVDEFAIRFCVDKGPDTTPPRIEGTSIANGMPIKFNQSNVELEVYVNENAECKWSRENRDYKNMETEMACSKNVWEMNNNLVYTCKTTLTGVKDRQDNKFYFRCKDQPNANESDRNTMQESYPFSLIGTETLNIIDVKPNGTIKGSTEVVSVNIEVETANGYKNGEAVCSYSETGKEADWIDFFDTGKNLHTQRLDLIAGNYKYYIKCVDLGGNRDDNFTEFKVEVDNAAPAVARVYRENELLKVITTEKSECRYDIKSCNFKFEDGIDMPYANQTSHFAEWKTENNYYIRCSDEYGNIPLSNQCSIIVRPYDVVEQKEE